MLFTAYIIVMIVVALCAVYLYFAPPYGCPDCGFFSACDKCDARFAEVDEKLEELDQ